MGGDYFAEVKGRDPYSFKKAEDFFHGLDNDEANTKQPQTVFYRESDQQLKNGEPNPVSSHGRVFRFDDDGLLLVQFMRPRVWRIRFDANNKVGADFTDYNTYVPCSWLNGMFTDPH